MGIVSDGGTIFQAPYLQNNSSIAAFTFFCWVKYPTTVAGSQSLINIAGTTTNAAGLIKTSAANKNTANYQDDSTGNQGSQEAPFPVSNVWYPLCGIFFSRTAISLAVPGATSNININVAPIGNATWNQFQILGRQTTASSGVPTSFLNAGGMLAECAFWMGALQPNETDMLVKQNVSPWRVRRPMVYLPLRNSVQDYGPLKLPFSSQGTNGTSFTGDHPPIGTGLSRAKRTPEYLAMATTLPPDTGQSSGIIGGGVSNLL